MSFGWSAGDIVAGVKIVWDIWNSISDGPLNATHEATEFFNDFEIIKSCLESWDSRDPASSRKPGLTEPLRRQCTKFIEEHMRLIQNANGNTRLVRDEGRNWLRKAPFTRQQVLKLYQQVQWPFVRGNVARLRQSLELALGVATYRAAENTHEMVKRLSISLEEIRQAQLDMLPTLNGISNPRHRLADLVTRNLNRIINPLESGRRVNEIDYSFLLQFERELHPPEPFPNIQVIRAQNEQSPSSQTTLVECFNTQVGETVNNSFSRSTTFTESTQPYDDTLVWRLENLSMRVTQTTNISVPSHSTIDSTTQNLIGYLKALRRDLFGSLEPAPCLRGESEILQATFDSKDALTQELAVWKELKLDSRSPADRINPDYFPARKSMNRTLSPKMGDSRFFSPPSSHGTWSSSTTFPLTLATTHEDLELDMPQISPQGSPPNSLNRYSYAGSTMSSVSLVDQRRMSMSSSLPLGPPLDPLIPVLLDYNSQENPVDATIQFISRTKKGTPHSVWISSMDGQALYQHSLDPKTSHEIETSMKPFLENRRDHKFRVQFMGDHKITMTDTNTQVQTVIEISRPPVYVFDNKNNFERFQNLLLNKEVKCHLHIMRIEAIPPDNIPESHNSGSICVLRDPINSTRSIFYFRTRPDPNKAFVEWSVKIFKNPDKPRKGSTSLTLRSANDKITLQLAQVQWIAKQQALVSKDRLSTGSARKESFSSTSSKGSTTSSTTTAQGKPSAKHEEKLLRGLVIYFCNPEDCLKFWNEFTSPA